MVTPAWVNVSTFYFFAAVTLLAAVGVVVSTHIIRTAVWLLLALVGVAGLYFLLAAEFLAATQLVVYVGGTLVLIIFGVMLTGRSSLARYSATRGDWLLATIAGMTLIVGLTAAVAATPLARPAQTPPVDVARGLGIELLSTFLVAFELASVLLLVVMIGAAFLAKPHEHAPIGETS